MPASPQDIKDFFALTGSNPPVTNSQLLKLDAWLEDHTGESGSGALVDYLYTMLKQQAISHQRASQEVTF